MLDLNFISFKQAFINEEILRMIFENEGQEINTDFRLSEPGKIQRMYLIWNGKLINNDFKSGIALTEYLNKTMVKERLCRLEDGRIKECFQKVLFEKSSRVY